MLAIDHILAPVDFSEPSKRALAHALELHNTHDAHLHLLHVLEQPAFPSFYEAGAVALYGELPDMKQRSEDALRELISSTDPARIKTHVVEGKAGREIVRFASDTDIDLIVIASEGLSGVERMLLGSVAERVVRRAQCPIFVVKAEGKFLTNEAGPNATTELD